MIKEIPLSEYLTRAPLSNEEVELFLKTAVQDGAFLADIATYSDLAHLERLSEKRQMEIGRSVIRFVSFFLQSNNLPLSGLQQLISVAQKELVQEQ